MNLAQTLDYILADLTHSPRVFQSHCAAVIMRQRQIEWQSDRARGRQEWDGEKWREQIKPEIHTECVQQQKKVALVKIKGEGANERLRTAVENKK